MLTIQAIITGEPEKLKTALATTLKYQSKTSINHNKIIAIWHCETTNKEEAIQDIMDNCINPVELEELKLNLEYLGLKVNENKMVS